MRARSLGTSCTVGVKSSGALFVAVQKSKEMEGVNPRLPSGLASQILRRNPPWASSQCGIAAPAAAAGDEGLDFVTPESRRFDSFYRMDARSPQCRLVRASPPTAMRMEKVRGDNKRACSSESMDGRRQRKGGKGQLRTKMFYTLCIVNSGVSKSSTIIQTRNTKCNASRKSVNSNSTLEQKNN